MAKRERNKKSARKARQKERERVAAAQAVSAANSPKDAKRSKKSHKDTKTKAVAKADRKGIQVVTGYFSDVRAEMHQVTWPSRIELRSYTIAVIVMLIVFGVAIWLVDTGFVAALVRFTGLRG